MSSVLGEKETLDVFSDPEAMSRLRQSKDIARGDVLNADQLRALLDRDR